VTLADIQKDNLPAELYDFILATDVLEHLSEDGKALSNIMQGLKRGGHVLITVPCFQSLWGPQDIVAQHLRRYGKSELLNLVEEAGLNVKKSFYFNYLLFVPIWIARRILMKANKIQNENEINSPLINALLKGIFYVDCWSAPFVSPPFGVSAFVLAQKP
jgi:SAM-dependent methyltransferase